MIIKMKNTEDNENIKVYDDLGIFVGNVKKSDIMKLASRKGKTSIRIDNDLRSELGFVFGDKTSMNDVIQFLKDEHDKNKED